MTILVLFACSGEGTAPSGGFRIVGSTPEDGEEGVVEAQIPELRFSNPIDADACDATTLRIDGVLADGEVVFPVEVEVVSLDDGLRIQLTHEAGFPTQRSYVLSAAAGGEGGCVSLDGEALEPFAATFFVP